MEYGCSGVDYSYWDVTPCSLVEASSTFQTNVLPPSSGFRQHEQLLAGCLAPLYLQEYVTQSNGAYISRGMKSTPCSLQRSVAEE
jgi:hypothetical protein